MPLVSVLVPAYNHEKYIQETIESIICQTYKNIELIVIDDGSNDNTFESLIKIEDKCKNRFVKTIFKRQSNIGCAGTLNNLMSFSSGDFIYIIASDDVAEPNAIETLLQYFSSEDVVLVVGDDSIIDSESNAISWGEKRRADDPEKVYDSFWEYLCSRNPALAELGENFGSYDSLVKENYIPNGYIIRKSAFIQTNGFTSGTLEDWDLHLQLSKLGKYKFVMEKLFRYRWHATNTIKKLDRINKLIANTKLCEENRVLKLKDSVVTKKFYDNINWSSEFFLALDKAINSGKKEDMREFRTYYKKLGARGYKQRIFYMISFIPFAFKLLKAYRSYIFTK